MGCLPSSRLTHTERVVPRKLDAATEKCRASHRIKAPTEHGSRRTEAAPVLPKPLPAHLLQTRMHVSDYFEEIAQAPSRCDRAGIPNLATPDADICHGPEVSVRAPEQVGLDAAQRDVDLDKHVALLPAVGGQGTEGGDGHVGAPELRQVDAVLRTQ